MSADNFEELVSKCVLSGFPQRLLYVFVRAAFMDEGDEEAGVVQVLFDAHQPAQPGLNFADVRTTADAQSPDWNIIVVGSAKNSDASRPSDEQATAFLADMREKILVGDIADFSLLDRDGQPLEIETEIGEHDDPGHGQSPPLVH